jgi:hypothetical protein
VRIRADFLPVSSRRIVDGNERKERVEKTGMKHHDKTTAETIAAADSVEQLFPQKRSIIISFHLMILF